MYVSELCFAVVGILASLCGQRLSDKLSLVLPVCTADGVRDGVSRKPVGSQSWMRWIGG